MNNVIICKKYIGGYYESSRPFRLLTLTSFKHEKLLCMGNANLCIHYPSYFCSRLYHYQIK